MNKEEGKPYGQTGLATKFSSNHSNEGFGAMLAAKSFPSHDDISVPTCGYFHIKPVTTRRCCFQHEADMLKFRLRIIPESPTPTRECRGRLTKYRSRPVLLLLTLLHHFLSPVIVACIISQPHPVSSLSLHPEEMKRRGKMTTSPEFLAPRPHYCPILVSHRCGFLLPCSGVT
jgi:hypothetical protein